MARKRRHFEAVPQPPAGARAVLYLRYSSDKQQGSTLEKQRMLCQERITAEGWQVVREYVEPETTAKSDEIAHRPQFAAMLTSAARHEYDVAVVECVDRWGRAESVFWESLKCLDQADVYWTTAVAPVFNSVVIKQEGFDLAFAVSVGMAASYSRMVSRKSSDGLRSQALQGYHHSHLPFGYMRSDPQVDGAGRLLRRHMVADPQTFPLLADIADLRTRGWGSMQIGDAVHLPPSHINRILTNKSYVEFAPGCANGTVATRDGVEVEGVHPAAWSRETWQRIQQMNAHLYGKPRATAQWHRAYPLGGLMRCSVCHRRMIAHSKHAAKPEVKIYRYYDCYDHDRVRCPSPKTAIPCDIAEAAFGRLLVRLSEHVDWQRELLRYLDEDPRPAHPTADQRHTLERQMAALDAKLDMGRITPEAYRRDMRTLQATRATLPPDETDRRDTALAGAARIVDVATGWQHATAEQRQEMATLLVQPLGLAWDHATRAFIAIRAHAEFVPGFAVALGWETSGEWLVTPGQTWQPGTAQGAAS